MTDIKNIIQKMTIEEKARILCGYKTMETYPIERLNIPSLIFSDGPAGVRKEDEKGKSLTGISNSLPTTSFPCGNNMASTWNKNLIYDISVAISKECKHFGIDALLGPAINIRKNPLNGRNFEYYSEDPYLSGVLATKYVKGLEDNNVGACLKHFACNNNETHRFFGDSLVDERTLFEIYLRPFEKAIKDANPSMIMSAYNKVNGVHASENDYLLKTVLKDKWNYHGLNLTDWGGLVNRSKALNSGTDLEMPGMVNHNINDIINSVNDGRIDINTVDESVSKILKLVKRKSQKEQCDFDENFNISYKAALESGILLKNNGLLPLKKDSSYFIVGSLFEKIRYQGSGSSLINPCKVKTHKEVFDENKIDYEYQAGYIDYKGINKELEDIAYQKALDKDVILVYAGLTDYEESEGFDRPNLSLAKNQLSLIKRLSSLNKKMVLVLFGGNAVELDIEKYFDSILYMGLPGASIGLATYDLLFGNASPSGKLPITWPKKYEDILNHQNFLRGPHELYKESIYVGYRYFETVNKDVLYPFGFGLSYANFEYKFVSSIKYTDYIEFNLEIINTSNICASDVIEIYYGKSNSGVGRAKKVLCGFEKIRVNANDKKQISIKVNYDDLKIYDINKHDFVLEDGIYEFYISKSVNDVIFKYEDNITGELLKEDDTYKIHNIENIVEEDDEKFYSLLGFKPLPYVFKKRHYTLETPLYAYESIFGKLFCKVARAVGATELKKGLKSKKPLSTETERKMKTGLFVANMVPYNNLRSMCFSSSGKLKYNVALAILDFVNGKPIKGLLKLIKKDKIYHK